MPSLKNFSSIYFYFYPFLIVFGLLGFLFLVYGVYVSNTIFSTLAGAVIGTFLAAIMSRLDNQATANLLSNAISADLYTDEERAISYRNRYHMYHVTMVNGQPIWRYHIVDFSKFRIPRVLLANIVGISPNGGQKHYTAVAAIRENRFILLIRALEGEEPSAVTIYPQMGGGFRPYHCGVRFITSWDGYDLIAPTIISLSPLVEDVKSGTTIENSDFCNQLEEKWKREICNLNHIMLYDIKNNE